jgi:hypothetical protein
MIGYVTLVGVFFGVMDARYYLWLRKRKEEEDVRRREESAWPPTSDDTD